MKNLKNEKDVLYFTGLTKQQLHFIEFWVITEVSRSYSKSMIVQIKEDVSFIDDIIRNTVYNVFNIFLFKDEETYKNINFNVANTKQYILKKIEDEFYLMIKSTICQIEEELWPSFVKNEKEESDGK